MSTARLLAASPRDAGTCNEVSPEYDLETTTATSRSRSHTLMEDSEEESSARQAERLLHETVFQSIADSYYPDRVKAAAIARSRAQGAQSIVAAVTGALVAVFSLSVAQDQPLLTRVGGCVSVALWLIASFAYVRAVAIAIPKVSTSNGVASINEFVRQVLKKADAEAASVDKRQAVANWLSVAALLATVATFSAAILQIGGPPSIEGTVYVNEAGAQVLSQSCGRAIRSVTGEVVESSIVGPFIQLTAGAGVCGTDSQLELSIPRAFVELIESKEGQ